MNQRHKQQLTEQKNGSQDKQMTTKNTEGILLNSFQETTVTLIRKRISDQISLVNIDAKIFKKIFTN